jgi:site-specific DNA-methyltransferase (cytosine-N4-specific)
LTGSALVVRGDAGALPLTTGSVDLIITSPPYWSLRAYEDGGEVYEGQVGAEPTPGEYVDSLVRCTREWLRVLKPRGSLWVNLGDKYGRGTRTTISGTNSKQGIGHNNRCVPTGSPKSLLQLPQRYAIACVDDLRLTLRAEVIWDKPNAVPDPARDRAARTHETWYHFSQRIDYYASRKADRSIPGMRSVHAVKSAALRVPEYLGVRHHSAFPLEWPLAIIEGWCPPGGVVLDPMGGGGTTALAAKALGRVGISVDLSADYCRIARWRVGDPRQLARAGLHQHTA